MQLIDNKVLTGAILLVVTLVAGFYPFYKHYKTKLARNFPLAEAFSCGIFLGVGFLHLLVDSIHGFSDNQFAWGYALGIAAIVVAGMFLLDLLMHRRAAHNHSMPLLVFFMLSIHAFFEGSALGLTQQLAVLYMVFFAIVIHKWAESFALSVVLTVKNKLSFKFGLFCFVCFSCMTPLGILMGAYISGRHTDILWLKPACDAIAAGTFIYFGSAHTFSHLKEKGRKQLLLRQLKYWLLGLGLMALVSMWV